MNQVVTDNTRARTATAWKALGKTGSVPTPVLDVVAVLIQRIEDLEEELGYVATEKQLQLDKVDTQGR